MVLTRFSESVGKRKWKMKNVLYFHIKRWRRDERIFATIKISMESIPRDLMQTLKSHFVYWPELIRFQLSGIFSADHFLRMHFPVSSLPPLLKNSAGKPSVSIPPRTCSGRSQRCKVGSQFLSEAVGQPSLYQLFLSNFSKTDSFVHSM